MAHHISTAISTTGTMYFVNDRKVLGKQNFLSSKFNQSKGINFLQRLKKFSILRGGDKMEIDLTPKHNSFSQGTLQEI